MTTAEVTIKAAMSVAKDVAEGRLDPAGLEVASADAVRELAGQVVGDGDALWPVQVDVARQVLALGGVPSDELAEWLAVQRTAEGVVVAPEVSWIERTLAEFDDAEGVSELGS